MFGLYVNLPKGELNLREHGTMGLSFNRCSLYLEGRPRASKCGVFCCCGDATVGKILLWAGSLGDVGYVWILWDRWALMDLVSGLISRLTYCYMIAMLCK